MWRRSPKPIRDVATLFSVTLAMAAAANAQNDADTLRRLERQLRQVDATYRLAIPEGQPIDERLLLDYGASIRFAPLLVDNQFGNTRTLRQTDGVLYLRAELDGAHRFFGRLRFLYNDFNDGDSFDDDGDELEAPIGDRYWYEYDLRGDHRARTGEQLDYNINARIGRQYVQWGTGLSLSNVLYAGLVELEGHGWGLTGLVSQTPSTGTIDFDGSRPGFDEDTDRQFFGMSLEYRGLATHRPYFSFLSQVDKNERDFATIRTLFSTYPTKFDYDSDYFALGSRGSIGPQLRYHIEVVHETGRALSNSFDPTTGLPVVQTKEDIQAWAGLLNATYLFRDDWDSSAVFEFIGGSGDDDRIDPSDTFGGNTRGTKDKAFNGLGYVNTGLALAPEVSNLLSLRLGFSTSPLAGSKSNWLRLGIDGFLYAKADDDAPLTVRTTTDTFIGGEIDLSLDWRITSDVSSTVRYGIFLPGDAMPAREDDPRHFLYAGVTYAF